MNSGRAAWCRVARPRGRHPGKDQHGVGHPVTVLNVPEETAEPNDVDQFEHADRAYWEKKSAPGSLAVMHEIVSALEGRHLQLRLTYNRQRISAATSGRTFCWFRPRKAPGYCHVRFRITAEERDSILESLEAQSLDSSPSRADRVTLSINVDELPKHLEVLIDALLHAEVESRT